jgi:flavodoxin
MSDVLLVYYSRTGYTASVAREISGMTGWDCEELHDVHHRVGAWGFVRSLLDVVLGRHPAIEKPAKDPADYKLVVLAAPVWMGRLSSPIRTYIAQHRGGFKQVAYFCTYGGKGAEHAAEQCAKFLGKPLAATLAITDVEIEKSDYRTKLDQFLWQLRALGAKPDSSKVA